MDEAAITTIYIVVTALIGVAAGTLFERRWWLTVIATPLVGLAHGLLIFVAPYMEGSGASPLVKLVAAALSDQFLLIAAMVATATGSAATAAMLHQSRKSAAGGFWLPDMEPAPKPAVPHSRRSTDRLQARMESLPVARTRALVERGYEAVEPPPVFEVALASAPAPAAPLAPRPPTPPPSAAENARSTPRRRTLLPGRLCTEFGTSPPCTIHNLSTGGAQVRLSASVPLPKRLYLVDISHDLGHHAEVRWRFGGAVGLRFLASFDMKAPNTPEAASFVHQWTIMNAA